MKYFAGIVPPNEIYYRLLEIQSRFGDNRLEPHITLRAPVSPLQEQHWINTIVDIAAACKPFIVKLPGTGYFGNRVLFVSVDAEPLNHLYQQLIPALQPFEPNEVNKGLDIYHPHLTLGRTWCGFTPHDFKNMQQLADEYLSTNNITFKATHIRIYYKPDHHGRYQPYRDVVLNG